MLTKLSQMEGFIECWKKSVSMFPCVSCESPSTQPLNRMTSAVVVSSRVANIDAEYDRIIAEAVAAVTQTNRFLYAAIDRMKADAIASAKKRVDDAVVAIQQRLAEAHQSDLAS